MNNQSTKARLKYAFDNFMSAGSTKLISYLGLVALLLVLMFATILYLANIHPDEVTRLNFVDTFWTSLMHVLDPGTIGEHDGHWDFRIFMFLVTLLGIVILSILIGLISNGIMDKLDQLRKGRSFVMEQDHVLILGWSSKIFTIIPELIIANENQKDPKIVILADKDKVLMEDEIKDKIGNTKNTKIICRTGNPIDLHDLEIGNPVNSKSIIILDKENENSDSQIIKTILAIISSPHRRQAPYHITAEIENKRNFEVAKMVGKDEVELILSDDFVSKIMVQTSRQSGLSVVYIELMDFGGDEIYFVEEPKLVGKTFREAIFSYEDSAIIGIQFASDNHVEVNPPMSTVIQPGDLMIGVTEDDDTMIVSNRTNFNLEEGSIRTNEVDVPHAETILLIGWNNRAKTIIQELDNYVQPGSSIKVISKFDDAVAPIEKLKKTVSNLTLEFEMVDTTDRAVLEMQKCQTFDYIMLLCYQEYYPIQEADAQTLITLLHLRNISSSSPRKMNIVSEMLDMRNRQLADITSADDFIVSDKLLSLLMTQVAENKYLMRVFEDLFDADGSEIYIKPVTDYINVDKPVNFYTILESAARKNEVAIGYRKISDARNATQGYGVVVNPKKSDLITFSSKDKIIVLSED
ncbi:MULTISPECIES: potassium transporter TrkA [unclassified Imperialibacter]|uniref:CASTOR/POLLUX-related putative ion channel n=1 Tax=unclassified Imperialibacter TaxID=2629706 RepID=UPI00125AFF71|nr:MULTISPECIES: potassium transporter TrkA [unclassified Imperialibacter]CAD5269480.1 Potassium transporter TrkA [Imperialibacter sp. 89]CAD5297616.1 Potassium transporter TrkA [Imperialibacter sp. 75]VVT34153.1 Potassium transporter TrkA [Imperialibacter sp. EC-SDR9]